MGILIGIKSIKKTIKINKKYPKYPSVRFIPNDLSIESINTMDDDIIRVPKTKNPNIYNRENNVNTKSSFLLALPEK
jgi:hypothetical protein